jgi:hypothetical protein
MDAIKSKRSVARRDPDVPISRLGNGIDHAYAVSRPPSPVCKLRNGLFRIEGKRSRARQRANCGRKYHYARNSNVLNGVAHDYIGSSDLHQSNQPRLTLEHI